MISELEMKLLNGKGSLLNGNLVYLMCFKLLGILRFVVLPDGHTVCGKGMADIINVKARFCSAFNHHKFISVLLAHKMDKEFPVVF